MEPDLKPRSTLSTSNLLVLNPTMLTFHTAVLAAALYVTMLSVTQDPSNVNFQPSEAI